MSGLEVSLVGWRVVRRRGMVSKMDSEFVEWVARCLELRLGRGGNRAVQIGMKLYWSGKC